MRCDLFLSIAVHNPTRRPLPRMASVLCSVPADSLVKGAMRKPAIAVAGVGSSWTAPARVVPATVCRVLERCRTLQPWNTRLASWVAVVSPQLDPAVIIRTA